jgi:hypothetical protein
MGSSYYISDTSNVFLKELQDLSRVYFYVLNNGGKKTIRTCMGDIIFTHIPELNIISVEVKEVSL